MMLHSARSGSLCHSTRSRRRSVPATCASSSGRNQVPQNPQNERRLPPPLRAAAPPLSPGAAAADATTSRAASADRRGHDQIGTLLVQCPDAKGVVASVAQLLFGFNCNILQSDQFTDETTSTPRFFQRTEFDFSGISVGAANLGVLERAIEDLAARYGMEYSISYQPQPKRMGILVSKLDHCLWDLLIRHHSGELKCEIPLVISNHPDLKHVASMFNIDFLHVPIDEAKHESRAAAKAAQEAAIQRALDEAGVDLVVLARYMQIFGEEFCGRNWRRTINIHHSFLPAFEGGRPYHRAHERGVKIIGATAHYATSELDAGPIIEQDITRITHRDTPLDMVRKGKDLERLVLARAVRWHLQDRVLVHENKTVVFED